MQDSLSYSGPLDKIGALETLTCGGERLVVVPEVVDTNLEAESGDGASRIQ